ncbi:MAG TPA: hypothetical protein VIW29_14430 [Polyangiaceae bacterium]
MLNDLDAVPWQSVRHAFGEASEVQRMLRELASSNRELRQSALKELFACLVHQGTVSEASALAVPFLFELLAEPSTPERNWIAFLLASIGVGKGYLEIHTGIDEQRWRRILSERGTTLEAERQREDRVVSRVHHELGRGLELLLPFLSEGQSEIRAAVARALSRHVERREISLPALEAALAHETAVDAIEAFREAIALLRGGLP